MTVAAVPLSKFPGKDELAQLDKNHGEFVKITPDSKLKIIVLEGPDAKVSNAVQALGAAIDRQRLQPREGERAENAAALTIEVVRLKRVKPADVIPLIKKLVLDPVEITAREGMLPALILEGERAGVDRAAMLARQIDGQRPHPALFQRPRGDEGRE